MSEALATPEATAVVPAQAYNPSTSLDASDMALPRIKVGQSMTPHVQEGRVQNGAIFSELGKDDPDPEVLAAPDGETVRFYVIAGPIKGWSASINGKLETYAFDDPNRDPDAWKTYKYTLAIPDADEGLPYTFLMTRTALSAAKQINTVLARQAEKGPAHTVGFDLSTRKKSNDKGTWFTPVVSPAGAPSTKAEKDAYAKHQEAVEKLAAYADVEAPAARERDEPAI